MSEMAGRSPRIASYIAPARGEPAGVGVYVAGVTRALADRADGWGCLSLIDVRAEDGALQGIPGFIGRLAFRATRIGARDAPNYHASLQLRADEHAWRSRGHLVHYTNAAAPLCSAVPYVLIVDDLSRIRLPQTERR